MTLPWWRCRFPSKASRNAVCGSRRSGIGGIFSLSSLGLFGFGSMWSGRRWR